MKACTASRYDISSVSLYCACAICCRTSKMDFVARTEGLRFTTDGREEGSCKACVAGGPRALDVLESWFLTPDSSRILAT